MMPKKTSDHSLPLSFSLFSHSLPLSYFLPSLTFVCFLCLWVSPARLEDVAPFVSLNSNNQNSLPLSAAVPNLSRVARSPFAPPSVTSFKPSIKKSSKRASSTNLRIPQTKDNIAPPFISAFEAPIKESLQKESNKKRGSARIPSPVASPLLKPPMVTHKEPSFKKPKKKKWKNNQSFSPVPVLPLNDETFPTTSVVESKEAKTNVLFPSRNASNSKGKSEERFLPHMTNFYDVLDANDKKQIQEILKQNNLSLDYVLSQIQAGRSMYELLETSKSLPSLDNVENKNNNIKNGNSKLNSRQKLLTELPFTEIVHNISIEPGDSYDTYKFNNKDFGVYEESIDFGDGIIYEPRNNINYIEDDYKSKSAHPKIRNKEKSRFFTSLPAKDSPMVLPFLPPKRKSGKQKGSASISSITVKVKKTPGFIPTRSKVIDKEYSKEKPVQVKPSTKQSNLRLVFPLRGILLFCGILGILSIVTIIILVVYGAVKCNRTPSNSSYQLTESQDLSSLAGSSIKSINEKII